MKIEIIKNIEGKLLFLDFGKINYIKTEFDIELIFIKLKRVYETISSITVLNDITEKVIVVKASYGAMAYFKRLDIYENGEKIGKIRNSYTLKTLFLTNINTKYYKVGDTLPFCIKDENRLLKILLNQNFACFTQTYKKEIKSDDSEKPEIITNFYIIPCTEIYMAYFGQYDRTIIDSTFTGTPEYLYNHEHTKEFRLSSGNKDFIKLSKYFQHKDTLAPYIVYRLYDDKNFRVVYNNSRIHIRGKEECFYSEFPLEIQNNIKIDYLKVDENIFYCTKIKSIESSYQYPKPLSYDIENAQGTYTTPNTVKVAGIKTIKPLPHITGTDAIVDIVNEPRNPSAIRKIEEDNDEFVNLDFTSKLVKVEKLEKKTTNTDSNIILPPSSSLTIQHGTSGLSNSAQVSTAVKNSNIPDENVKEIILEDLEQIRLNFSKRPEITDLKYYLGRTSHSIKYINSDENKGKISKWIYINNGSDSVRNFGILEMKYKGKKYYVLDVQKREAIKDAKQVKEGICLFSFFFTDVDYYLDSLKFDAIKKIIISEKGIFTSVLKKLLTSPVPSNFPIKGDSFIHSSLSADKIFSKIQEWGKTNY